MEIHEKPCGNHGGVCAICLDKIVLQETALIKGCEHAYWLVQQITFLFTHLGCLSISFIASDDSKMRNMSSCNVP